MSVLVVVQFGGGCEWWAWSSDSVVVADAELPRTFSQSLAAPAEATATTPAPPTAAPPASVAPTTVPASTTVPAQAPTVTTPTTTSPPPTTVPPPALPAPLLEPAAPVWVVGTAQARALEPLRDSHAHQVASQALALIRYDWPNGLPGWEIRFLPGRTGYRGLTYPEQRVIEVFVRPADTPESIAHVTAHEIAHAIDVDRFGPADRSAWSAARGHRPGTPWFVHSGVSDFASGAGDFAESFAWWQTTGSQWSGHLGPPPSPTQTGLMALLTGAW